MEALGLRGPVYSPPLGGSGAVCKWGWMCTCSQVCADRETGKTVNRMTTAESEWRGKPGFLVQIWNYFKLEIFLLCILFSSHQTKKIKVIISQLATPSRPLPGCSSSLVPRVTNSKAPNLVAKLCPQVFWNSSGGPRQGSPGTPGLGHGICFWEKLKCAW